MSEFNSAYSKGAPSADGEMQFPALRIQQPSESWTSYCETLLVRCGAICGLVRNYAMAFSGGGRVSPGCRGFRGDDRNEAGMVAFSL